MPVILATDMIVYVIAAAAVWAVLAARREGEMRRVIRSLAGSRLTAAATALLAIYLVVALADSVRWRDRALDPSGAPLSTQAGAAVYKGEALSLLDRALSGMRLDVEKTYSAPLSATLYVKETVEGPDGAPRRDYQPLKHPRSHVLGTDKVGNDVLFLALKGVRTAVVIGTGTTIVIIPFAIFFGVLAGYFGGLVDDVIQYLYTTLSSVPGVLLIVAFMLLFGETGYQGGLVSDSSVYLKVFVPNDRLFWLCLILGITSWTDLCRLVRGETLKLREMEYVDAARAFGVSRARIIYRHVVPNLAHLVIITFVLQFSALVLAEAVLSYIGIGVGPGIGSWGNMINTARLELTREPAVWWNLLGAFAFMFALVLPANVFADAVQAALDPRSRGR